MTSKDNTELIFCLASLAAGSIAIAVALYSVAVIENYYPPPDELFFDSQTGQMRSAVASFLNVVILLSVWLIAGILSWLAFAMSILVEIKILRRFISPDEFCTAFKGYAKCPLFLFPFAGIVRRWMVSLRESEQFVKRDRP